MATKPSTDMGHPTARCIAEGRTRTLRSALSALALFTSGAVLAVAGAEVHEASATTAIKRMHGGFCKEDSADSSMVSSTLTSYNFTLKSYSSTVLAHGVCPFLSDDQLGLASITDIDVTLYAQGSSSSCTASKIETCVTSSSTGATTCNGTHILTTPTSDCGSYHTYDVTNSADAGELSTWNSNASDYPYLYVTAGYQGFYTLGVSIVGYKPFY